LEGGGAEGEGERESQAGSMPSEEITNIRNKRCDIKI